METERTKQNALWSLCSFMALLFSHRPEPPPQKSEFPTDIETLSRMNVNSREHEKYVISPFGTENLYLTILWPPFVACAGNVILMRAMIDVRERSVDFHLPLVKLSVTPTNGVDTFFPFGRRSREPEPRNRLSLSRVAFTHFPELCYEYSSSRLILVLFCRPI